jgi:hypothetical protein
LKTFAVSVVFVIFTPEVLKEFIVKEAPSKEVLLPLPLLVKAAPKNGITPSVQLKFVKDIVALEPEFRLPELPCPFATPEVVDTDCN